MLHVAANASILIEGAGLSVPAIAVHGGAGTFKVLDEGGDSARVALEGALAAALEAGWRALSSGRDALAAAVEAVASMEDSGLFNAGRGSVLTTAGTLEADAGVMDGATRRAGGVCCTSWPANPVRAALAVARLSATPAPGTGPVETGPVETGPIGTPAPVLLAGPGADEFARAAGLPAMPFLDKPGPLLGPEATGTVGAVAVDREAHVAAATSTGGLKGQRPGRVGDSAVPGAGTWADDETAAVSGTGTGEAFLLAGFAHRVDSSLRTGTELEAALAGALEAVIALGGLGGAIAISPLGELRTAFCTRAMARGWRDGQQAVARC
jgi:L-asparaginase / beta-aspartyl-peptidase